MSGQRPVQLCCHESATLTLATGGTTQQGQRGANNNSKAQSVNNKDELLFTVYPNPSYGNFVVKVSKEGIFTLNTIEGRAVLNSKVAVGNTTIQLPETLAAGIYMAVYTPSGGDRQQTIRFVYQP